LNQMSEFKLTLQERALLLARREEHTVRTRREAAAVALRDALNTYRDAIASEWYINEMGARLAALPPNDKFDKNANLLPYSLWGESDAITDPGRAYNPIDPNRLSWGAINTRNDPRSKLIRTMFSAASAARVIDPCWENEAKVDLPTWWMGPRDIEEATAPPALPAPAAPPKPAEPQLATPVPLPWSVAPATKG
jgi:hypothetical protein